MRVRNYLKKNPVATFAIPFLFLFLFVYFTYTEFWMNQMDNYEVRNAPSSLLLKDVRPTDKFVRVYMNFGAIYEERYFLEVVLPGVFDSCGGIMTFHSRSGLPDDLKSSDSSVRNSIIVLVADQGIREAELQAFVSSEKAKDTILFHLSDEDYGHRTDFYSIFGVVYHNYYRTQTPGCLDCGSWEYLKSSASKMNSDSCQHSESVFWFPLGYGPRFMASKHFFRIPLRNRPYWFGYAGRFTTTERKDFLRFLEKDVYSNGFVYTYDNFGSSSQLPIVNYTTVIASSILTPCPSGGNAEQFRLWETIYGGGIPVVLEKHKWGQLLPHFDLGLEYATIYSWREFSQFVKDNVMDKSKFQNLVILQSKLSTRVDDIFQSLNSHFRNRVCCALTRNR